MVHSTPIAIFLRSLRVTNNETRNEMASKLGITPSFLSAVENGIKSAPESWTSKIQKVYKLSDEETKRFELASLKSRPQTRIYWNRYTPKEKDILVPIIHYIREIDEKDLHTLLEIADKYSF